MLIGVANKMQYLRRSWTLSNDSKHNEASFSTISTDMLYLRVAQTPRSPDLAIFVLTTDDRQTDRRQTKPITLPLAHARGVIMIVQIMYVCSQHSSPLSSFFLRQYSFSFSYMYFHCIIDHHACMVYCNITMIRSQKCIAF